MFWSLLHRYLSGTKKVNVIKTLNNSNFLLQVKENS